MSNLHQPTQAGSGILPLSNIAVAERAHTRLMKRGPTDPGLGIMHGPSGTGKSTAAAWITSRHRAYYVQADDFWTRKTMLIAISKALGLNYTRGKGDSAKTYTPDIYTMAEAVKAQLECSQRLLIIDEFDYCVAKGLVESVRSLYEGSKAAILLIGEEMLPQKLEAWERFHGRMLDWFPAEMAKLADARILAQSRCPGLHVADDLLEHLVDLAAGSVRRLGNNLALIAESAREEGWSRVDLATWGGRALQSNKAPRRGV
ncbi:MAG: ATP-binding protein [Pseudomonadota bacterium]|nr:ATP-binding protein [Pseudomonadota bacterium]